MCLRNILDGPWRLVPSGHSCPWGQRECPVFLLPTPCLIMAQDKQATISRYSLGSLFSAGWWPPIPLVSWRAEILDKHKSTLEETLVAISRRNNWWNQEAHKSKPSGIQFYKSLFYGFLAVSCIALHVAISRWESQGEMFLYRGNSMLSAFHKSVQKPPPAKNNHEKHM